MPTEFYIGLMSGTSLDGVDGVLADFGRIASGAVDVHAHVHRPFDPALAAELLALNGTGPDEIHRAALAANALATRYAEVVRALVDGSGIEAGAIRAIGAHGQTVRHRPGEFGGTGYTIQLNNPALLAEATGIDVVADLRSRDVAAGGQGAPVVPAFHRAVFGRRGEAVAVLNLGGIANLTLLGADGSTLGFDCGPANALMDHWCRQYTGARYDDDGRWAARGRVLAPLLAAWQSDTYFTLAPPKSTGRDRFHPAWLAAQGGPAFVAASPEDVQATLAELTALTCAGDLHRHAPDTRELLVCGGGAYNRHLMARLAARLPGVRVTTTAERGLPPSQVEAAAFAWLARAFCRREPGNLPAATGAAGPRVLGALYPGR